MEKKVISIPEVITVRELAAVLNKSVTEVMTILLKEGILATINDNLDYETSAIIVSDLGFEAVKKETEVEEEARAEEVKSRDIRRRAPVITVLGHVDHGKTSLLDYIRKTKVTEGEAGGITQSIGAYQIKFKDKVLTFLDTPGHSAFSAMRAQGAKVTDLAILVVAADDGVKPQTLESINLIKAAEVPLVVAITKIDRPEANIEKVKAELAEHGLVAEAWGGKVVIVPVSSKTGEGIDLLLEMIELSAEMLDLNVPFDGLAQAVVIEADKNPKSGVQATLVVERGVLTAGDPFVVGSTYGKIRYLKNYLGKRIKEALPGMPVRISGFAALPVVGDTLQETASDRIAKELAEKRQRVSASRKATRVKRLDLKELSEAIRQSASQDVRIVLRADNSGSLEALKNEIAKIRSSRGRIVIIQDGVGNITESDVLAARDANGPVIGFNVDLTLPAKKLVKEEKIKVALYDVIYQLTDDLTELLLKSIKPERIEHPVGNGEVLKVFRTTPKEKIIGVKLKNGKVEKGILARFYDGEKLIGDGEVVNIQQMQSEITQAVAPGEFGFLVKIEPKIKEGFKVDFILVEEKKAVILT